MTKIISNKKWRNYVANLLYICSPSTISLSIVQLVLPHLKEVYDTSSQLSLTTSNSILTYLQTQSISILFTNLFRHYEIPSDIITLQALSPIHYLQTTNDNSSTTINSTISNIDVYFNEFATILNFKIVNLLIENNNLNSSILLNEFHHLKYLNMNDHEIKCDWLIQLLNTKYKLNQNQNYIFFNEFLLFLENKITNHEIKLSYILSIFNKLFEIIQIFQIINKLHYERKETIKVFASNLQKFYSTNQNDNKNSKVYYNEIIEYLNDIINYLN